MSFGFRRDTRQEFSARLRIPSSGNSASDIGFDLFFGEGRALRNFHLPIRRISREGVVQDQFAVAAILRSDRDTEALQAVGSPLRFADQHLSEFRSVDIQGSLKEPFPSFLLAMRRDLSFTVDFRLLFA
jgi:hypothetical protein